MDQKFHVEVAYPWTPSHWQRVATLVSYEAAERQREHWETSVAGMGVRILPQGKAPGGKRGRRG